MKRSTTSWLVCALLLAALLVWVGPKQLLNPPAGSKAAGDIGGAFTLTDEKGKSLTDKDLRGKYLLVYFGFTHCPDICPTTLLVMRNALERLGEKANNITPVFITLDPERDTPEVMARYVTNFGERLIGLTGTAEQIKSVADAYHVYYSRVEQPESAAGYLIDHSGFVFLMDDDGHYVAHFPHSIPEGELAVKLGQFLR
jgi:protein SCO1/2